LLLSTFLPTNEFRGDLIGLKCLYIQRLLGSYRSDGAQKRQQPSINTGL
jgi:hypothetical protein